MRPRRQSWCLVWKLVASLVARWLDSCLTGEPKGKTRDHASQKATCIQKRFIGGTLVTLTPGWRIMPGLLGHIFQSCLTGWRAYWWHAVALGLMPVERSTSCR
eukprot:1159796-Pelagomonas_calceolata.AAC.13